MSTVSGSVSSVQLNGVVLPLEPLATRWCLAHPVYFGVLGSSFISCEIRIRNEWEPMYAE